MDMDRRSFLKGAAVAGGAAAFTGLSGGLSGCAPQTPEKPPEVPSDPTADLRRRAALLNPQDYDYRSNTTDFSTLFSPWQFGKLTIPNRVVKSAAGGSGSTTFFAGIAKNGVKMVYTSEIFLFYNHFGRFLYPASRKPNETNMASFKAMVDAVHNEGAYFGYQMNSFDMNFPAYVQKPEDFMPAAGCMDMTYEEIKYFIEDTIAGAKILKDLGVDAIEINAAATNIPALFLSRYMNKWDNEYGAQNMENRTRLLIEILKGIKKVCGSDFPVQILINGIEENEGLIGDNSLHNSIEETKEICKILEAAGADSFHVRLGPTKMHPAQFLSDLFWTGYGMEGTTSFGTQFDFTRHWQGKLVANHSGCGLMIDVAAEIKQAVSKPVGAVCYMDPAHAPDFFENALAEGKIDFMLMHRPLYVDNEYLSKLREGRIDEIAPCTRCYHCHQDMDHGRRTSHCRVNPVQVVTEGSFAPPLASVKKKVMVVGGGPAGMEAARIAAMRGHSVTLYEKKDSLGGLLEFAHNAKGPHENLDRLRAYLTRQLELKGVTVVTGKEVDAAFIKEQAPDAVILATGGVRDKLGLKESAGTKIVSILDFMTSEIGENVVVVGSNLQAIDAVMYLIAQGKRVNVVTPSPLADVGEGHSYWTREYTQPMIKALGTRFWTGSSVKSIGDGEITIKCDTGVDVVIPCDTVIDALDMLPDSKMLNGLNIESYAVGDCNEPYNFLNAIKAGNLAARAL